MARRCEGSLEPDACDDWDVSALPVARSRPAEVARLSSVNVRSLVTAAISLLTVGLLLIPVGAIAQIVLTAQLDDRTQTQAIIVMDSARSWGDPREMLDARLTHAAELYHDGIAPVVIVTGPAKVGDHALAHLRASGVPADDVVTLTTGADTVGALDVVATVLRDLEWESVTVVTDPAHAARAAATASGFGIDAHLSPTDVGAGTALTSDTVGRETAALLRYYLFTRPAQTPVIRP